MIFVEYSVDSFLYSDLNLRLGNSTQLIYREVLVELYTSFEYRV